MRPAIILGRYMTAILLALISAGVQEAPKSHTRLFEFKMRLQRPSQPSGILTMERGTLLQPIDLGNRGIYYQSVVVCESVNVEFDESGRSDLFIVKGFCFNPGVPPPPRGVEWRIGGLVSPRIRERCELLDQIDVRAPKPLENGYEVIQSCENGRNGCTKKFDQFLRIDYKKNYDELHRKRVCRMVRQDKPPAVVWELQCDKRKLAS